MSPPNPPPDRPSRGLARRILRAPVAVLVALYFILDDVVLAAIRPVVRRLEALRLFARVAAFIHGLPPYPTLLLFAVPFAVLEPPKLISLYLMATGRFRTGLILLIVSHLLSIVLVERLFHVTRDKLLMIPWFARAHGLVVRLRDWALGILEETSAWQAARRLLGRLREAAARLRDRIRPVAARWAREARRRASAVAGWIRRMARG
ncbi:hypothetical protein [Prosthecomicrobium sp. N25]|uniref:hypothetical protein n=1 Tax=Prosthecomicrobium sp. N25 TaxID=3129254 RepID=UPI0030772399